MTTMSYLAQSLPWSVVGLLVGHILTRGALELVAEVANPEGPMTDTKRPHLLRRWFTYDRIIGVVVFTLAVTTVVQGYVSSESTRRIAECTKNYSDGFADALEARSNASSDGQAAIDQWVTTLSELMASSAPAVDPAATRQRFRDATTDYLAKRAEARKQQQQNPFPLPPRDVCE